MTSILQFTAKAVSRHPKYYPLAYNKVSHKYAASYVQPEKWGIQITHTLSKDIVALRDKISKINPNPNKPNFEKMLEEKMRLQAELDSMMAVLNSHEIRFNVKQGGGFSRNAAINDYDPILQVPGVGTYTVTITAKKSNGATTTKSTNITFQDILIVSLGDSYAAGEGNPDKAGNPSDTMEDYADQSAAKTLKSVEEDISPITSHVPNVTPEQHFADWQEPLAHRSYRSGHSLAAERVEGKYSDLQLVATFLPLSRSGAKMDEGLIRYNAGKVYNERRLFLEKKLFGFRKTIREYDRSGSLDYRLQTGQIDEAKATVKNRKIDFLVLTIGGNDIKWSTNIGNLVEMDSEFSINFSLFGKLLASLPVSSGESGDAAGRRALEELTNQELSKLPAKFNELNQKIRETLNPKHVLITEYPSGFFGTTDSAGNATVRKGCGIFDTAFDADINAQDAALIRDLADKLNTAIKTAAIRHGWVLVDGIAEEFGKHGYCAPVTYFVSAEKSFKTQGDWYGLLHPNAKGHDLYGRRISAKIQEIIQANVNNFRPRPGIGTVDPNIVLGP